MCVCVCARAASPGSRWGGEVGVRGLAGRHPTPHPRCLLRAGARPLWGLPGGGGGGPPSPQPPSPLPRFLARRAGAGPSALGSGGRKRSRSCAGCIGHCRGARASLPAGSPLPWLRRLPAPRCSLAAVGGCGEKRRGSACAPGAAGWGSLASSRRAAPGTIGALSRSGGAGTVKRLSLSSVRCKKSVPARKGVGRLVCLGVRWLAYAKSVQLLSLYSASDVAGFG